MQGDAIISGSRDEGLVRIHDPNEHNGAGGDLETSAIGSGSSTIRSPVVSRISPLRCAQQAVRQQQLQ
jgi:hypothetical protein